MATCECNHSNTIHASRGAGECLHCDKNGRYCKCKKFKIKPEDSEMENETTEVKVKKVRKPKAVKVAKAKKEKKIKVVPDKKEKVYEVTAKDTAMTKKMLDAQTSAQYAIIYRAISENGPVTFDGVWSAVYRKMQSEKVENEKQKTNTRTYIHRLIKDGFVKVSKRTIEQASTVAA